MKGKKAYRMSAFYRKEKGGGGGGGGERLVSTVCISFCIEREFIVFFYC